MSISYNGYKNNTLTMENNSAKVGYPVTVDSDGQAIVAGEDKSFIGICVAIRGDVCSVQTDGFINIGYSGTVSCGDVCGLVSDGNGKVKASTIELSGRGYTVLTVDKVNNQIGIIM